VRREVVEPAAFGMRRLFDGLIGATAMFAGGIRYERNAITSHRMHDSNQRNRLFDWQSLQPERPKRLLSLELYKTLSLLAQAEAIPSDRRRVFAQLQALVAQELASGTSLSFSAEAFILAFMRGLDQLGMCPTHRRYMMRRICVVPQGPRAVSARLIMKKVLKGARNHELPAQEMRLRR
jgi:hypothetical protein